MRRKVRIRRLANPAESNASAPQSVSSEGTPVTTGEDHAAASKLNLASYSQESEPKSSMVQKKIGAAKQSAAFDLKSRVIRYITEKKLTPQIEQAKRFISRSLMMVPGISLIACGLTAPFSHQLMMITLSIFLLSTGALLIIAGGALSQLITKAQSSLTQIQTSFIIQGGGVQGNSQSAITEIIEDIGSTKKTTIH